jgi:FkbM family methyltransferase
MSQNSARPRIFRALELFQRFSNPWHVLWKRAFGKPQDEMLLIDKQTGIRCRANIASYHMCFAVWYRNEYDIPYIPIRKGDIVVDIGANQGFFTCLAAHRGATVYAFEPDPESFERLVSNVKLNGFSDRVVAKPWAISDFTGSSELMVSTQIGGGMSTIVPGLPEKTGMHLARTVTVPCHTLPEVLDLFSISRMRLCKIDVEGSEFNILASLSQKHFAPMDSLAVELHHVAYSVHDLLRLLAGWGTHQISFKEEGANSSSILWLTSTQALLNEFSSNPT